MRSRRWLLLVLLFLPLLVRAEDITVIPRDTVLAGNAFRLGQRIDLDGTVEGDAILVGSVVTINGQVGGDLVVVAQQLTVKGKVGGSLRAAAGTLTLSSEVGRNVTVVAQSVTQATESVVRGSFAFLAQDFVQSGTVESSLDGTASVAALRGKVAKDVHLHSGGGVASVGSAASIGGAFVHTGKKPAVVETGATITGGVSERPGDEGKRAFPAWVFGAVGQLLGLLLVGLAILWLFRKESAVIEAKLTAAPLKCLLVGLAVLLATPIVSFLLLVTLVGLPLGLFVLAAYLAALYLTKVFVAVVIGRWLLRFAERRSIRLPQSWSVPFIVGALTLTVVFDVLLDWPGQGEPFVIALVGTVLGFGLLLWGLGGIVLGKWQFVRSNQ